MMQDGRMVSVIMPVFNGERYLAEAIESVLAQDYHPLELIVVDDGSTDGSAQIASGFGGEVRYTYQHNQGPAVARNMGLELARGEIIGFLDADDRWPPGRLDLQLACLAEDPSVEVVMGQAQYLRQRPDLDNAPETEELSDPLFLFNLSATILRKSVFDIVGRFDPELYYCDDYDWFFRAQERGVRLVTLPQVTLHYRRHEGNITNDRDRGNSYFMRTLKKRLDRQRQQELGTTGA
jgi:glycosyltransferase involved in cell wall biosynthesis